VAKYASANGRAVTEAGYGVIVTTRATPNFPEMELGELLETKQRLIEETKNNFDLVVAWLTEGRDEQTWEACKPAEAMVFEGIVTPDGRTYMDISQDGEPVLLAADDALVDVWQKDYPLTITSNCDPRDAYIEAFVWMKVHGWGKDRREPKKFNGNGNSKRAPKPAPAPQQDNPFTGKQAQTETTTTVPTEGTLHVGQYDSKAVYADNQIVAFDIVKIDMVVAGDGDVRKVQFYNPYGNQPGKFPVGKLSIYSDAKFTPDGVLEFIRELGLEPGKSVEGNWRYVARVARKNDKQYFNVVKIEVMEAEQPSKSKHPF